MSNLRLRTRLQNCLIKTKLIESKRRLSQRLKSRVKILLLVNSSIQISVDVNKPFAIKCCATTQTKALLYIH